MEEKAFQDSYPDDVAWCFGCGHKNPHGHHIRSFWDAPRPPGRGGVGDEEVWTSVCHFQPEMHHTAMPGFVYGGLIASLIDCHSTGTAAAAAYRSRGRELGSEPALRFVTASLHVDYLRPTPLGPVLEVRGRVEEVKGRKVVVNSELLADGVVCAKGRVVAVELPDGMK